MNASFPFSAPAERNKQPILEVLQQLLPPAGTALEIAAGTGQHAEWFARALPGWTWQPTDADADNFHGIDARCAAADLPNVLSARLLDVLAETWPSDGAPFTQPFDLVYCANMLHISPWPTCAALMRGAARSLAAEGMLVVYGPFLEDDVVTSAGNVAFDNSLRARDPAWGIRRLEDVKAKADAAGLRLEARHPMPANNLLLAFVRGAA